MVYGSRELMLGWLLTLTMVEKGRGYFFRVYFHICSGVLDFDDTIQVGHLEKRRECDCCFITI